MDFKEIKELIRVFDKSELNKLKVKEGDFEISLGKGIGEISQVINTIPSTTEVMPKASVIEANVEKTPSSQDTSTTSTVNSDTINSPMVGTFYTSPSPEAPEFVKVGDTVKKGQTLCILEAMKIMNEVEAECDCKILEVLVKDASPVEYDMPLFVVEKL